MVVVAGAALALATGCGGSAEQPASSSAAPKQSASAQGSPSPQQPAQVNRDRGSDRASAGKAKPPSRGGESHGSLPRIVGAGSQREGERIVKGILHQNRSHDRSDKHPSEGLLKGLRQQAKPAPEKQAGGNDAQGAVQHILEQVRPTQP